MQEKIPSVYMVSNKNRTVLYVGVTSDLISRIAKMRQGFYGSSFAKKYNCADLLYYEFCGTMEHAILREKQVKGYRREKKDVLVNEMNPEWVDLYPTFFDGNDVISNMKEANGEILCS